MQPDRGFGRAPDVDMVREREIGEAHLAADLGQQLAQRGFGLDRAHLADEAVYPLSSPSARGGA